MASCLPGNLLSTPGSKLDGSGSKSVRMIAGLGRSDSSLVRTCGDGAQKRKSWSPTHLNFGAGRSPLKEIYHGGSQFVRHTSLMARMSVDTSAEQDKFGSVGALSCIECGLPEKALADQWAGPGSSPLEQWLEGYLAEIVRHLPEAPFLQYVPKYNSFCGARQRVAEELFEKPESWKSVKHCLLESAPDGIILVHRLDHESLSECCMNDANAVEASGSSLASLQADGSSTDVWGVLVHGCKTRRNACYILKTTQVAGTSGILTHFCLSRAKCFGPSLRSQLQSTWLL